jgi:sugar lactone lactonase YvrE
MRVRLRIFGLFWVAIFVVTVSVPIESNEPAATRTSINGPADLAIDNDGHLLVIAKGENKVRRIDLQKGTITTIAGNGKECCYKDGSQATDVSLRFLSSLAVDSVGNIFIGRDYSVLKIDTRTGLISTVAGDKEPGVTADGVLARSTHFWDIDGLAVDRDENLYVADAQQSKIFRIDADTEIVHVYAGSGKRGHNEDTNLATAANFELALGVIALDNSGNLIIADYGNCRVSRIDHVTRALETVAVTGGPEQNCAVDWPDPNKSGPFPSHPVSDSSGNIYFVVEGKVLRVDAKTSVVSTFAGTSTAGFGGDKGLASQATFTNPSGLAFDSTGNLFIADFVTNRVRRVDARTGIITTIAGNGLPHRVDIML